MKLTPEQVIQKYSTNWNTCVGCPFEHVDCGTTKDPYDGKSCRESITAHFEALNAATIEAADYMKNCPCGECEGD